MTYLKFKFYEISNKEYFKDQKKLLLTNNNYLFKFKKLYTAFFWKKVSFNFLFILTKKISDSISLLTKKRF